VEMWQLVTPNPFCGPRLRRPRRNAVQGFPALARPEPGLLQGVSPASALTLAPPVSRSGPGWGPAYPWFPVGGFAVEIGSCSALSSCNHHARGPRPALGRRLALGISCASSPVSWGAPSHLLAKVRWSAPPARRAGFFVLRRHPHGDRQGSNGPAHSAASAFPPKRGPRISRAGPA
jgi:hypothetical protein